jgi:hypothetical protein
MAETTIKPPCKRCNMPQSADWQWCHACGYDPDHLRPDPAALVIEPPRPRRPRRRLGGLLIVVLTAIVAVSVVLWVVVRNGPDELLTPPVDTTPQLGPDALGVQFNAAISTSIAAEDTFQQARAQASAGCGCASGETDPQGFARDAALLLPVEKTQEQQLVEVSKAASPDVAEQIQLVIAANRRIQSDIGILIEHKDDTDTDRLLAAQLALLKDLATRAVAIQKVQESLGLPDQGQPRD